MHAPLGSRAALLGDFGVGLGAALGGRPRRARIDMRGRGLWPSAGATLDLDFVNQQGYAYGQGLGRIRDLVTISGGAGGTVVGPSGLIVSASAPRFDYDPLTLARKGLLVEEQRTNKCTNSNANPASLAGVSAIGDAAAVLSVVNDAAALASAGLSGICTVGNVFKLDNSAGTAAAWALFGGVMGSTTAAQSLSVYMRGDASVLDGHIGSGPSVVIPASAGYVRSSTSGVFTNAGAAMRVRADAGKVIYFILNQLEEGAFPTSPVVVAGSQVTRTADRLSITGAKFLSLYGPHTAGTLLAEFTALSYAGGVSRGVASLTNGLSTWNGFYQAGLASIDVSIYDGSVVQADALFGGQAAGVPSKVAAAFAPNDWIAALNGALSAADQTVTLFAPDRLLIGTLIDSGAYPFCGHIRRLRYWPRRLSNTELQELTR